MTDLFTKENFQVDDMKVLGFFQSSGTIAPRRPVYATGNLRVNQATANDPELYAGMAAYSGTEGAGIAVYRGPGTAKVWITGGGNVGDGVVATGIYPGAAFRPVKHGTLGSGATQTYTVVYASGLNAVGELLQEAADGDLALVYFWK
jgi:hypothetical protein